MAKRNQVTTELRISADAQLKQSRSFIKEIEKIADKLDVGTKLYAQLNKAKDQLKDYNKILEKVQSKSLISDDEIKVLTKASKEIANIIVKTEKMHNSFSADELRSFTKEYIKQVKEQEAAVAKIKKEYSDKTGKNFDKEIKNLQKYQDRLVAVNKEIDDLQSSKDSKVEKAIKAENQRLQEQFNLLKKIENAQEAIADKKSQTYRDSSAKTGFSIKELKGRKPSLDRENIITSIANNEYQKILSSFKAISQERDEILKSGKDSSQVEQNLIALAKKYHMQAVNTTEEFEQQFQALVKQKNYYKSLDNRRFLVTEKAITEEYNRRIQLIKEQNRLLEQNAKDADAIAKQYGFTSTASMNAQKGAANRALNKSNISKTENGANLNESGENEIATTIASAINKAAEKLSNEEKTIQKHLADLNETNDKLATQSERGADQQDIDNLGNKTTEGLRNSTNTINAYTTEDNRKIAAGIMNAVAPVASTDRFSALITDNVSEVDYDPVELKQVYPNFIEQINNDLRSLAMGETKAGDIREFTKEQKAKITKIIDDIQTNIEVKIDQIVGDIENIKNGPASKKNFELLQKTEEEHRRTLQEYEDIQAVRKNVAQDFKNVESRISSIQGNKKGTFFGNAGEEAKKLADNVQNAVDQTQFLGSAFNDIKNKVGYFLSMNYVFDQVVRKVSEAKSFVKSLDKDMVQIGLVLGQTASQTWKNFDTYSKMANRLSTTTSDVTAAMKLFYQQGLKTAEVNKMVEASAIAAALGESTMAQASETLTSIINSYNLSARDALTVTDKISQVAIVSAADFGELSKAIEKVASQAATVGLDLDHMMGYLGKMIETTREAPTNIGTALKTILANFAQFKEDPTAALEDGADINKAEKALKSIGIQLLDSNGEMRDLGEVIDELGKQWESLTRNQKSYLATTIAGTRQQSRFYSMMNDYDRTLELISEASDSAGKSTEQFARYEDSLTGATARLNNQWEIFYSNITKNDGILKTLANGMVSLFKAVNTLGPELSTVFGVVGIAALRKFLNATKLTSAQVKNQLEQTFNVDALTNNISQGGLNTQSQLKTASYGRGMKGFVGQKTAGLFGKIFNVEKTEKDYKILLQLQDKIVDGNLKLDDSNKKLIASISKKSIANKISSSATSQEAASEVVNATAKTGNKLATDSLTASTYAYVAAQTAATLGITALIAGITAGIAYLANKGKNAEKRLIDLANSEKQLASQTSEATKSLESQINRYIKLTQTVNKTEEEKEELFNINKDLAEQNPELVAGINEEGEAYLKATTYLENYLKKKKKDSAETNARSAVAQRKALKSNINLNNGTWYGGNKLDEETPDEIAQQKEILDNQYETFKDEIGMNNYLTQSWAGYSTIFSDKAKAQIQLKGFVEELLKSGMLISEDFDDSYIDSYFANAEQSEREAAKELIKDLRVFQIAQQNALIDSYNKEFASKTDLILLDTNLDDKDQTIISNFTDGLRQSILNGQKDKFDNINDFTNWVEENYDDLSDNLTNGLLEIFNNKEQKELFIESYNKILEGQEKGEATAVIDDYYMSIIKQINSSSLSEDQKQALRSAIVSKQAEIARQNQEIVDDIISNSNLSSDGRTQNKLIRIVSNSDSSVQQQILNGLQELNDQEVSEDTKQAYLDFFETILTDNNNDLNQAINSLDFSNYLDVVSFKEKWKTTILEKFKELGIDNPDLVYSILDSIAPTPELTSENLNTKNKDLSTKKGLINKTDIQQSMAGEVGFSDALDNEATLGEGFFSYDKFIVSADSAVRAMDDWNKKLKETIELEKAYAKNDSSEQMQKIAEAQQELANIQARYDNGQLSDEQYKNQLSVQEDILQLATKQLNEDNNRLKNAKRLSAELERQEKLTQMARDNSDFINYVNEVDSTVDSLKDYATIYEQVQKQELSQLDILDLLANNLELVDMAYIDETGKIALNAEALRQLGEQRIEEAWLQGETQIAKLEMQKAAIDGTREYTQTELDFLATMAEQWSNLSADEQQALIDTATQLGYNVKSTDEWATFVKQDINGAIRAWQEYFKASKDQGGNEVSENGSGGGVSVGGLKTSQQTVKGSDAIAKIDEQISKIRKYQDLLSKYKNDGGALYKDINAMGGNSGGSDDNTFEPVIEKLEKFYNYMRQLEELEAKINRLREKRNLIDASKNYYIDDLEKENSLLREQQAIYNNYVRDQGSYLAELQSQIQAQFGDWAYFNEDGVVQVKQTEFTANSEAEQERLELFLELIELYQNEYNTREENINKLYEIESTQLENIQTMYDKILSRVTDITDELNRQKDLLDHDMTMSFSNIGKFDIMDSQAGVAVEGIKNTNAYINNFKDQIKSLKAEVENGPFSELLLWDETLQSWRVNEEALQDPSIIAKYEKMGYTWQDIDTYIRSVAVKSQSINEALKETVDSANQFAEALKQLIDDRISLIQDFFGAATDELNKIFDTFDRKMDDIDNQNNLFGIAENSLEEKYLTAVTAVAVLKQTIQTLKDNKGTILETIKKDYPEFVNMINDVAVINKQAIEESTKLTEAQKADLLELYGIFEASEGQITEMEDKLVDYFNTMMEMEEAKRDAIIELKQSLHDELIARDQQEIDDLRSKYDKMSQLDNEYYSELSRRVSDARTLRDNRQQSANIGQMQAQLAVLKADNSGAYNDELINLQKQLNDALQTQADNEVTRELERIQREQQEREEDRQLTISAMENVLTFKDENSWYWQEAQRIWSEGPESVTGFLKASNEYANISDEQRAVEFENLTNSMNTAFATLQTAAGETSRVSNGIVTSEATLIRDDLDFIQSQLGEDSTLATKIDWSNSENVRELDELDGTVKGLPDTIKTNMQSLYDTDIEPGINGVVSTIQSYLGTESAIWNKLDAVNQNLGTLTSTTYYSDLQDIVTALTGDTENSVTTIVKTAQDAYLARTGELYNWLSDKYATDNADKNLVETGGSSGASTKVPTTSGNGNSVSSTGGKGSGSNAASKPQLKTGSKISVKPGVRWYHDSYGGGPSGTARGGIIQHINLQGSHPYNIEGLGWIRKQDIVGYSKGGYVDYTGIANVHGTQTEPEAFLNAKQTRLFEGLRDSLVRSSSNRAYDKKESEIAKEEYNIDNISIEVKQIADIDAVDKITRRVKEEIYKDATSNKNNMAVRRR